MKIIEKKALNMRYQYQSEINNALMIAMMNFCITFKYFYLIYLMEMMLIIMFYFYLNFHLPKKTQYCINLKK